MHYYVWNGGNSAGWRIYRSIRHPEGTGTTFDEAAQKLRGKLRAQKGDESSAPRSKRSPFEVRYRDRLNGREYGVWRAANGRRICVRKCESVEEARQAIREDREALEAWWDRWRTIPESRRAENAPRSPGGSDGTEDPDTFTARYRFRGVQFGNWVEDQRRRTDLRDTSQGLSDLAHALGWPVHALSLEGELALAFGARGKGGARRVRAHYEPAGRVIAISKPLGPGTLAHEWFHALDHHVGRTAVEPDVGLRDRGQVHQKHDTDGRALRRNATVRNRAPALGAATPIAEARPAAGEVERVLVDHRRDGGTDVRGVDSVEAADAGHL